MNRKKPIINVPLWRYCHEAGLLGCLRKLKSVMMMTLPVWILGRRTNKGVGAYFDLITEDARLFYGDNFHFGYFQNGTDTLQAALDAHTDLVSEMAHIPQAKETLDIGCGICAPAIRMVQKNGNRITGINISREQVRQGKALVLEKNLADQITVLEGNALHLEFEENSFDAIVCLEVASDICVSPDQKNLLIKEMYRVLKPGGYLGFSDLVFKEAPSPQEEKSMRLILYHEGRELITDWPSLFKKEGFEVCQQQDILQETMKTWKHSINVYETEKERVEQHYGKRIAALSLKHLCRIPGILEKYGSFVILSLRKPPLPEGVP